MAIEIRNSHLITEDYLRELGVDHPFGRICCQTRTMRPTVCDGTCRGCKKSMSTFRETEPVRIQTQDIIQSGGDIAYEPLDIAIYKQNLEKRIARWQSQKENIVNKLIQDERIIARQFAYLEKLTIAVPSTTRLH